MNQDYHQNMSHVVEDVDEMVKSVISFKDTITISVDMNVKIR